MTSRLVHDFTISRLLHNFTTSLQLHNFFTTSQLLHNFTTLLHHATYIATCIKVKGTSRTTNNQAFTIKKGMSMPVQMSQAQDGERPQVDDQRLDLADDLKEAQDHISSTITSH
ncbi:hypothetical protein Tco_1186269 [Tanacetum coccineum]